MKNDLNLASSKRYACGKKCVECNEKLDFDEFPSKKEKRFVKCKKYTIKIL